MTNLEVLRAVQHVAWPAYCWPFGNGTGNGYTLVPSPSPPSTTAMGESKTFTSDNSISRGSKRSRSQSQGHKTYEDQQTKISSNRKNSSNMESPSSSPPRTTKCGDVKSERLSPDTVNSIISNNNNCNISNKNNNSDSNNITTNTATNHSKGKPNARLSTPSPSSSPKSQSSNRTRTPSSFPGTPPHPAFTPPISLPPGCFSPAALGGLGAMGALPGGPGNLAALTRAQQSFIEKQMPKNCSDLMRSLAAKYNNSNNNIEFYSTQIAKTFPRMPVSPVIPFKHSYSPSTSTLLHPSADQSQILRGSADSINPSSSTEAAALKGIAHHNRLPPQLLPQNLASSPFTTALPNHPLNNLSSTQAFIDMVRSSTVNNASSSRVQTTHRNVSSENERSFEEDKQEPAASPQRSHLNPSSKRMPESSCPLDLSSSFSSKRTRFEESSSPQVALSTVHEARTSPTLSNASPDLKTTGYNVPTNACKPGDNILSWSVEDVSAFVESIDLCAEYAEIFREQRIDGWCLSLLTESHLTSSLKMKLGPALKLKNILATKTNQQHQQQNSCLHCCHNNNVYDTHEPDHHHHRSTPSQRSPATNHLGSPSHPYNERNTGPHSESSPYSETDKTLKSTSHNESMSSSSNDA